MSAIVLTPPQDAVCQVCGHDVRGPALKCEVRSGCGKFTHLKCSELPAKYLVRFDVSRASYLCEGCVKTSAGDNYDEYLVKFQRMMNEDDDARDEQTVAQGSDSQANASSQPRANEQTVAQGSDSQANASSQPRANEPEILARPAATSNPNSERPAATPNPNSERRNHVVCRDFLKKKCSFGKSGRVGGTCGFWHPRLCRRFLKFGKGRNGCSGGGRCANYHPKICWRFARSGSCNREDCQYYHQRQIKNRRESDRERERESRERRPDHEQPQRSYSDVLRGNANPRGANPPNTPESNFLSWQSLMETKMHQMQAMMQMVLMKDERGGVRQGSCQCGKPSL